MNILFWGWLYSNAYPNGPVTAPSTATKRTGSPGAPSRSTQRGTTWTGVGGSATWLRAQGPLTRAAGTALRWVNQRPSRMERQREFLIFCRTLALPPNLPYNHQSSCAVGGILEKSKTAFLSLSPVTVTYFLLKIIISGKRKHWPSFIYIHKSIMSSWIRFRRQLVRKKRMAMTTMTWQVAQTSRKPSR